MQQSLALPKTGSLFVDESEEERCQKLLNLLSLKKLSWEQFSQKVGDFSLVARLTSPVAGRTLLHLAVLDQRLEVVRALKDPSLRLRQDGFGLSCVELAQFLGRNYWPASVPLAFPASHNLDYLPTPVFEEQEGLEKVLALVAKAKKNDRIPAEKIWMGIYFDKELRQGIHPPISIEKINDKIGYGVFADKKILPGAYVGEYTGTIQEKTPNQLKKKRYCLRYPTWEGKKAFVIDAEKRGNFTRFINHSVKPNLGVQAVYWRGLPRMIFVALKEIQDKEQLTFDYGPLFWKHSRQTPYAI